MLPATDLLPRCPVRTTLELLGGKWRLLLIAQLAETPLRPVELRRRVPEISETVLNRELRFLEQNHLIGRETAATGPRRTVYSLTERGRAALPLLEAMAGFARAYREGAD